MDMSVKKEKKVKEANHTPERPKTCVGELCWNPKSGKLEFEYDRKTCPREIVEKLDAQTPMILRAKAPKFEESEQKP
jgi:hypothetical protein